MPCEATRETVPAFVLYPTAAEEREVLLGRYPASLAPDAPVHRGPHPIVLVSHGTGSSPFLHRTLAAHLARRGFVVALVEHPRNNRDCDDLAGTDTVLRNRPLHLGAVLGHVLADGDLGPGASGVGVGVVGHSLGGCTALALAGGRPTAFGHETPDGAPAAVPVAEDDRIRALVLLAPATPWFMAPGSLAGVRPPVLVFTGSRDEHTPAWHGRLVEAGVAGPVDHRVVDGAGHFSFLSPFPPHLVSPALPPSQDPPGFDRPAFFETFPKEVRRFLDRHLR